MKFAYFPGCSAKGTCPELHKATIKMADALDIKLIELDSASCCGAGVIQEKDPNLARVLNIRTLAQAEKMGLDILTICGTCQGNLGGLNKELKEDDHLWSETLPLLEKVDIKYNRSIEVKHILWLLSSEEFLTRLKEKIVNPLTGLKVAPFYGCHILRPSSHLGFDNSENPQSLERLIEVLGATPVEYPGKLKCCGFPIVLEKENIALDMVGKHVSDAKSNGADCMVTPCPLCHMNLDIYQDKAEEKIDAPLKLPVLHLPQLVSMALGLSSREIQTSRHLISTEKLEQWTMA